MEEALVWFQDADESSLFTSWEPFVRALQIRFGSTAYNDPIETFTRLRQTSAQYKAQFKALSNHVKGFSKRHKLSCFLNGLKDEV